MILIRKTIAIFLLLTVVAYSGGVSISKHFCKGKITSRAFNTAAKPCKKASCKKHQTRELGYTKPSCCNTEQDFFKSFNFEKNQVSQSFVLAIAEMVYPKLIVSDYTSSTKLRVEFYKPPPDPTPIYVRIERYLI